MKKSKTKNYIFRDMNKTLLVLTLIFSIGGAFLILDASSISSVLTYGEDSAYYFFKWQLIFVGLSFIGTLIVLNIPTKHYRKISSVLTFVGLIWLMVQVVNGFVVSSNVSTFTISIGGSSFQVAELVKIFSVMLMGTYYSKWIKDENHKKYSFLYPLIICALPAVFVALGGDAGSAAIMVALVALTFIALKSNDIPVKVTKIIAIVGIVGMVLLLKFGYLIIPEKVLKSDYRLNRLIYTNPCKSYESENGYQVCNGYIAIQNGGLFGRGIGESTQKYLYLPASHTDFIFPIIIEELGVITGIVIILGYMWVIYIIFKISSRCYTYQNSMICYGIGIYFILHIFINLCGVLGIFPLTGIPLPFLSYGGSSCVTSIGAIAIIQRINVENENEKRKREIRKLTK